MSNAPLGGLEPLTHRPARLLSLFATDESFTDSEVAALRREVEDLKAKLASRTESWRQVLRQLSEAESALCHLRGELTSEKHEPLSDTDWDKIVAPVVAVGQ